MIGLFDDSPTTATKPVARLAENRQKIQEILGEALVEALSRG